jgi:hypothetical protein
MGDLRLLTIPIWGESRLALEHAGLQRDPVLRGEGVERGDGAPCCSSRGSSPAIRR